MNFNECFRFMKNVKGEEADPVASCVHDEVKGIQLEDVPAETKFLPDESLFEVKAHHVYSLYSGKRANDYLDKDEIPNLVAARGARVRFYGPQFC